MDNNYGKVMETLRVFLDGFIRLFTINIIWFICNIPFFIVMVNFIMTENMRTMYLPTLFVLFPLLFFPSFIGLYATIRTMIMKKQRKQFIRTYFQNVKKNYVQALLAGLVWSVLWAIWGVDLYYFNQSNEWLGFLLILIGFILFVYMILFVCVFVHFQMTLRKMMKYAFFVTIGRPLLFIIVLVTHAIFIYIGISKFWMIFPIILGSATAFISFWTFWQFTKRMDETVPERTEA